MKNLKTLCYLAIGIAVMSGMSAKSYATGSMSGTVTDTSSNPVSEAIVIALLDGEFANTDTTASDGTYSIPELDPGTYELHVLADGYEYRISTGVVVTHYNNTVENIINLAAEGIITGTVTKSDETTPIADVLIIANDGSGLTRTATTNSNGEYTINKLPAATYTVSAIHSGYKFDINGDNVVTSGSTTSDVDLIGVVPPSGIISGTVTLSGGSTGIQNVAVLANDDANPDYVRSAITNANGEYTIDKLPAGTYTVSGVLSGYNFDTNEDNVVTAGSTTSDVDLTGVILPTGKISGRVTRADGTTPIEGASVYSVSCSDASIVTACITDSSGDYELTRLDTDTYTVRALNGDGIIEMVNEVSVTNGSTTDLDMSRTEGAISGTVTDSSQDPIEGSHLIAIGANGSYSATTNANGDYIIKNIPAGTYTLWLDPNDGNYAASTIEDITVVANTETSDQDFSLGTGGKISGTITDSSQEPIEDATVVAVDPCTPSNRSFATTAADGTYLIGELPTGTYIVSVDANGYVSDSETGVSVTTGQTTSGKNYSLGTSGGTISGTVYESDGETPISGAVIGCYSAGKSTATAISDASGNYSITLLQGGTYQVGAYAEGYEIEELTGVVVTVPDENSNNDFLLDEKD